MEDTELPTMDELMDMMLSSTPGDPTITLHDVLHAHLPSSPAIYQSDKLASTLQVTETALDIPENEQLCKIVFAPKMLNHLVNHEEHFPFPPLTGARGIRTLERIHPTNTEYGLSPYIYCEMDVAQLVLCHILRPVMAALEISAASNASEEPRLAGHPYGTTIPDCRLVTYTVNPISGTLGPPMKQLITIEYKSDNVLTPPGPPTSTVDVSTSPTPNEIFASLLKMNRSKYPVGSAVKFHWPDTPSEANADIETRVIIQLWRELEKTRLGILTSYAQTIFLVRDGTTLYLSTPYRAGPLKKPNISPLMATYCFFKYALGLYGELELRLPSAEPGGASERFWGSQRVAMVEAAGVVLPTLCSMITNNAESDTSGAGSSSDEEDWTDNEGRDQEDVQMAPHTPPQTHTLFFDSPLTPESSSSPDRQSTRNVGSLQEQQHALSSSRRPSMGISDDDMSITDDAMSTSDDHDHDNHDDDHVEDDGDEDDDDDDYEDEDDDDYEDDD
ncbi:hypothetical protein BC629DRAFT_1514216 [Irpex lacteus]|nr:hypothetical protein BC629DRAFT_1514216 [Irpex lacteus]